MTTIEESVKLLKLFQGSNESDNTKYISELITALNNKDYDVLLERLDIIHCYIEDLTKRLKNEAFNSPNTI